MKVIDGMTVEQRAQLAVLEGQARDLAGALDQLLNPKLRHVRDAEHRTTGFGLLLFAFGEAPQPTTWISNAAREDMIRAVEEWLRHAKGRS